MKFHHIGIATSNINKTIEKIKKYFEVKDISQIVYDQNQDAHLCMITLGDGNIIELVNGKVVENILKKRHYMYHICYTVPDIELAIKDLVNDGAFLVMELKYSLLFNKKVAFLMCDLGLIELLEEEEL